LALAHDLGHPPYGHAGEDVLNECLADAGGFSHNRQALRIVEELEQRYPDFPGLNLSIEVLTGQATRFAPDSPWPLLEVQVVEAADSIAYDTHDADDSLELRLIELDELIQLPLWQEAVRRVRARYTALSPAMLKRCVLHELIDWQVGDLLERAGRQLADLQLDSLETARQLQVKISASPEIAAQKLELEQFLRQRVYRHADVLRLRVRAQRQLREMFAGYSNRPELLPIGFQARIEKTGLSRVVADYLAGMTDRFAQHEHTRLFAGPAPPSDVTSSR
jgi:dGTPase